MEEITIFIFLDTFCIQFKTKVEIHVNVNIELDKNVNLGIGQFVPILFSLIDIIKLSFLKIDRS